MKKMILVISAFILSVADANIRVGKTGGGLAEMKAYSVVGQLASIIKICSSSQARCGMDMSQRNDLLYLNQSLDISKLELVAPWSGPTKLDGFKLLINSQDLYSSGTPHRYGEILSLCLYVLLRDGSHMTDSAAKWPFQIFSSFQENMRSLYLPNFDFTLHSLALGLPRSNENMIQALALEKPKVTEDLTEELFNQMSCRPYSWSIETWNYDQSQAWVRAQLLWSCGVHDYSGEMQLRLSAEGVTKLSVVRRTQIR